ncbi:hypothetical protein E4K10_46160 [Streptomyces sp. T1317-0309]|nr:hypothetical protein E4K10_46160 [Streptomyces sp. T1317-0309]
MLELLGIRRHLPGRRRARPMHPQPDPGRPDGDALDAAIGAYQATTPMSAPPARRAPRSRGRQGPVRLRAPTAGHRHPLSAVTHAPPSPWPSGGWGQTNKTAAFRPLLQPLDLAGTVVTFDALHISGVRCSKSRYESHAARIASPATTPSLVMR